MSSTGVTWRALLDEGRRRLGDHIDARRIAEEASGHGWVQLELHLDEVAGPAARTAHEAMVSRRAGGEPLQYVLGRWGFRRLDLRVDGRALIPRPETETLVQVALDELAALSSAAQPPAAQPLVVDLGTGSGAVACSLATEVPGAEVWATDVSPDALALADVNRRGLPGEIAQRIHLAQGWWWDALPPRLQGHFDLVVSNPPYVAETDDLPDEVARWEPAGALFAGPEGLDAIAAIVGAARRWLRTPGAVVVEVAADRSEAAARLAAEAGFRAVKLVPDLARRPRVLVGRV